jgi:hypothetical protein
MPLTENCRREIQGAWQVLMAAAAAMATASNWAGIAETNVEGPRMRRRVNAKRAKLHPGITMVVDKIERR